MSGNKSNTTILGLFIFLGLFALGFLIANAALKIKEYERTVTAKGLSEHEYNANIVIWPIRFTEAANNLSVIYDALDSDVAKIKKFLLQKGIKENEISLSPPSINDKLAQQYGNETNYRFRYTAMQTLNVYSENVGLVRSVMSSLSDLGKKGIVFRSGDYDTTPQYIFTKLNTVKPKMIEEATKNARKVAEKFAADSHSKLGKIKRAYQGQFTISPRDDNNPQIKKVRVVTTVEYYLSD